ncbi:MAG: methyl-accepting chemotaxis protein [Pseudomonadota bacterium]|nr:methyl-accepting chemotaxis protein [Pseudomonadota bacterium]
MSAVVTEELRTLRERGVRWLTLAGWAASFAFLLVALWSGDYAWQALLASALVNVPTSILALQRRSDAVARLAVGLMAASQPALLLYATRGSEWQIDMHMYFFVALASLTVLCDLRPIMAAAAAIALHHLLLAMIAPAWVFSGGGGIPRVLVHALAVVLQAAILGAIARSLTRTLVQSALARGKAQEALAASRGERARREALERAQAEGRRAELAEIGQAFEDTVSRVTAAVATTAGVLDETTKELDRVARDSGSGADGAAQAAAAASRAVAFVADHIADLSSSIASIAVTASQQDTLANAAQGQSQSGGHSVTRLAEYSADIGDVTRAITEVADQTNMLALNATIEAVRGGESGRGFAVVAQEVKTLARQAADATGEIEALLNRLRDGSHDAASHFSQISLSVRELAAAATAISHDVDRQRVLSADIEVHARQAAAETGQMAARSDELARSARLTERLSTDLKSASATLVRNVGELDRSARDFLQRLDRAASDHRPASA